MRSFRIYKVFGKQRPKATHVKGKTYMYTPEETVAYEAMIKKIYLETYPDAPPFTGAVSMVIRVYKKRPKSDYRTAGGERTNLLRPDRPKYPVTTPDLSNIEKAIEDALNGVAYEDDRQIIEKVSTSLYNSQNRTEYIDISLEEIE